MVAYAPCHGEQEIPHGSVRRRMVLHRSASSRADEARTPQAPRLTGDPLRRLLRPEERRGPGPKTHTTEDLLWTGRLHIASKVPLCRERRMYMGAARLRTIVPKGVPQARSVVAAAYRTLWA